MSIEIIQYLILNNQSYFAKADEFVDLDQLFKQETLFEKLNFWVDMVLYPLYTLLSIVFFGGEFGIFTLMTIHKTLTKWYEYFKYWMLNREIKEWKKYVKSVGGPFISTNDETYHSYVYADGMQRLHTRFFHGK
jgi:hypothetical protein